jgi:hypothetical protein
MKTTMKVTKINDIPDEVMWCKGMQMSPYVGMDAYDKMIEIMGKYPEYFKWEHTYNGIFSEVHDQYEKELSTFNRSAGEVPKDFEGLFGYLHKNVTLENDFNSFKIKTFNTIYGPYGIKYRYGMYVPVFRPKVEYKKLNDL